jgi:hypothetical protein
MSVDEILALLRQLRDSEAGQTVGQSLLVILATLLAGRTLRRLVYELVSWIAGKTRNRVDDQAAEDIATDLGLPPAVEEKLSSQDSSDSNDKKD